MEFKSIQYSVNTTAQGHKIGLIKISRPEAMNALNGQLMSELKTLIDELSHKRELRAAILTGDGEKAFVAGADIKEFLALNPKTAREMAQNGQALFGALESLPFPVIGALNGFALGGGLELALACDFILASEKCRWGLPEVTLGLMPGYGGTQRLVRILGRHLAKRVALSGEMFTAQQGFQWGLFAEVCEPSQLMAVATKLAETLASRAPLALSLVKVAIHEGSDQRFDQGLSLEAELFGRTFETEDQKEGVRAFIEKRQPMFQGT